MTIVLMANTEQREELTAQGMPEEMIWLKEFSSLEDERGADACIDLLFDDTAERIMKLQSLKTQVIIINSVITPLSKLPADFIRINGWSTFLKRPVIEASGNDNNLKKKTEEVFSFFDKKVEWVADITGFIASRIVASIINEAYFALEEQVSTKQEIDIAMKLGTNYPYGPFEWSEKIGKKNIYTLLKHLSEEQKRYEPATLLIKEATI